MPFRRKIAETAGLINHQKKDSTGICFIGERKFKEFLSGFLLAKPGNMETPNGQIIGQHDGLMFYTIGQRKGLKLGGKKKANEKPWYVISKDIKRNVLIIAQGNDNPLLFSKTLICSNLHWINRTPNLPLYCHAKIRYRQSEQSCMLESLGNYRYQVTFENPQRAITSEQSIVFYQGDFCLGGGIIE